MKFCYENNIILCRLPSHTSHILQPCDVGIFGPLKMKYREQVERLYRRGSNMIGKQHFTLLYDRARSEAFSSRNITSAWSKSGLRPFNPERVLKDVQNPKVLVDLVNIETEKRPCEIMLPEQVITPQTSESLMSFRRRIDQDIAQCSGLDDSSKLYYQKLANAAEHAFADRAILLDENALLFEQNNEKATRKSIRALKHKNSATSRMQRLQ
jgi:DDE superfamily endonuclease